VPGHGRRHMIGDHHGPAPAPQLCCSQPRMGFSARTPPAVVLGGEPLDQCGDLGADRRPAVALRVGPLLCDQAAVSPQDGTGRDQPVHRQPSGQVPDQCGEDGAVGPVQPGPGPGAAQHGDLVPQHQQLGVLGGRRAAGQDQPAADTDEDQIEQAEGQPACGSSSHTAQASLGLFPELHTRLSRTQQRMSGRGRAWTLPGLHLRHQPASFDALTHHVRPHVAAADHHVLPPTLAHRSSSQARQTSGTPQACVARPTCDQRRVIA
jgi:hypothetical protein